MPASASYTATDVLAAATRIQVVTKCKGYDFTTQAIEVYLDDIGVY
ncbi:MAG: hypothetical protein LLG37_03810 [Spirochaetia bacterium]|nr:hypothetical protein [Spirochaetia bacterium]